jgi:cytochrome bd-type quinol oxidase subunit 2
MHAAPIIIVIALLALFLIAMTIFKYAIHDNFMRTRLTMSALFVFIVATLSISFWPSAMMTLPFTIPAFILGTALGYFIGVRTERQKLTMNGVEHYVEHFAHIDPADVKNLTWWTIVNYYSIMCALVLINLVGFTNVILKGSPIFIVVSSVVGAALIGSILPYLAHLWTIPMTHKLHNA